MATLRCAFPNNGYSFGQYRYDVPEAQADLMCRPDPFTRIKMWVKVEDPRPVAKVAPEVQVPVVEKIAPAPAEEVKVEAPAPVEEKVEIPAPVEEKVEEPSKSRNKGK